jgi:SRSO17 transposase
MEPLITRVTVNYVHYDDILKDSGMLDLGPENIPKELDQHLEPYFHFLWRKKQVTHIKTIVRGLLTELAGRKTIQSISLAYGLPMRNLYHFTRDAKFDGDGLLLEHQKGVASVLSDPNGMITGDASVIPKKGKRSVGVGRGYRGPRGHQDNCQDGVFLGYVSSKGHAPFDFELYLREDVV